LSITKDRKNNLTQMNDESLYFLIRQVVYFYCP